MTLSWPPPGTPARRVKDDALEECTVVLAEIVKLCVARGCPGAVIDRVRTAIRHAERARLVDKETT